MENKKAPLRGMTATGVPDFTRREMKGHAALKVADKMLKVRIAKRISQEELAKLSGVNRETIKRMEKASHDPHLSSIEAVAKALRLEIWELFEA